ncbi:MAG: hypothetical protein ACLFV8_02940 [Alphaproteobacteria bacterium]
MRNLYLTRLGAGGLFLATLSLQACSDDDYEPVTVPDAAVQLAFEKNLENLGSAATSGQVLDGKLEFRRGKTGMALFAVGDGRWVEVHPQDKLRLRGTAEMSFDIRRADWTNPYKKGALSQTAVVLSGRTESRIEHIGFSIRAHSQSLQVRFKSIDGEKVRLATQGRAISTSWHNIKLKIDRENGTTQLFLDDVLAASAQSVPLVLDAGITRIKFGTWYKKNQAFRGHIDNFVIRDLSG